MAIYNSEGKQVLRVDWSRRYIIRFVIESIYNQLRGIPAVACHD